MQSLTHEVFVTDASILHNNRYDYSHVVYINTTTKVIIICPIHGEFLQTPKHHRNGRGCNLCAIDYRNKKMSNYELFYTKAIKIHENRYDYSLVDYKNGRTKIKIVCEIHNIFNQTPSHHLSGIGCPKCGLKVKSHEYFTSASTSMHGDFYDYSLVDYIDTKTKVKIICPKHGQFEQRPYHHYNGAGCPICNKSRGERDVEKFLIENKIIFIPQKRFTDCRDNKPLPFDFYLPEMNTCIEYDGKHHRVPIQSWGGVDYLNTIKKRDKIKTDYCKNNDIKLIRLNRINNIINILNKKLYGKELD